MVAPKLGSLAPLAGAAESLNGEVRPVIGEGLILVVLLIATRCGPPT